MKRILCICFLLALSGCATGSKALNSPSILFNGSLDEARVAAESTYKKFGFEVQSKDERCYRGHKPRKMGFFVGSGGETVATCFTPSGAAIKVEVETSKTVFGILGQENWDSRFLAEIKKTDPAAK